MVTLFKWANELLNDEDKVLSIHRSIFLAKFQVIPGDFISGIYLIKKRKQIY